MITAPLAPTFDLDPAFLDAFRSGTLTETQASEFAHRDPMQIIFLLLAMSAAVSMRTRPAIGPHTPSSALPPYAKPPGKHRKQSPGAKPGHTGHCRPAPERIDRVVVHELPPCPCCGGVLAEGSPPRKRIVEDIPANLKVEAVEHIIPRGYCQTCRKQAEPKVADALPNATIGHRATVLSTWLHFGLGTTTSQVVEVLNGHLQCPISEGGLTDIWHRLAGIFEPWYRDIRDFCQDRPVLHMDETSWKTGSSNGWLWCATGGDATYYWIHPSRGHEGLGAFFTEEFSGVLVTDFWRAYDAVAKYQQKCWPHLLRDLKEIDAKDPTGEWLSFSKTLKRIYADGIRLKLARDTLAESAFDSQMLALHQRLHDLSMATWTHPDARRLAKRLKIYWESLLRFVEYRDVPSSNNKAEREIRPAVLMRKASYGSASERGAATRSVLMSIYRTLKQRGVDVLATTEAALRAYVTTGQLPPLPQATTSGD